MRIEEARKLPGCVTTAMRLSEASGPTAVPLVGCYYNWGAGMLTEKSAVCRSETAPQ
jgi:hypothetical protein